jgi:hypothetical protein
MVKDEEKLKFHWELLVSYARTEEGCLLRKDSSKADRGVMEG